MSVACEIRPPLIATHLAPGKFGARYRSAADPVALRCIRVYARRAMPGRRSIGGLVRVFALAMVLLPASGALGAWMVNERGECVHGWTPASLARGPAAMLNAPLLPLRSAVGGVLVARDDRSPGLQGKILLPPTLAVVGGGIGLVDSLIWLGTGLTDTATGGYFELAPEEATRLGVAPVRPTIVAAAPPPPRESSDHCGRRTGPGAP